MSHKRTDVCIDHVLAYLYYRWDILVAEAILVHDSVLDAIDYDDCKHYIGQMHIQAKEIEELVATIDYLQITNNWCSTEISDFDLDLLA